MTMIEREDVEAAIRRVEEFLEVQAAALNERSGKAIDAQREALGLTTEAWWLINRYAVGEVSDPALAGELDTVCVLAFTIALFARQYADERAST